MTTQNKYDLQPIIEMLNDSMNRLTQIQFQMDEAIMACTHEYTIDAGDSEHSVIVCVFCGGGIHE